MASPIETDMEEGTSWKTTRSGRLEMKEEEAFWKDNGCFSTRLCKKTMSEGSWRRRGCMTAFVSVLFVVIVSVCSLPTVLYFSVLVSVLIIILTTPCMHKETVLMWVCALSACRYARNAVASCTMGDVAFLHVADDCCWRLRRQLYLPAMIGTWNINSVLM